MPRGDRTGPHGVGPRTGRGLGFCTGNEEPGYANPAYGLGRRMGRGVGRGRSTGWRAGRGAGWGRGNRNFFGGPPGWGRAVLADSGIAKEDEISWLESQAQRLKDSLENLQKRLDTLKG